MKHFNKRFAYYTGHFLHALTLKPTVRNIMSKKVSFLALSLFISLISLSFLLPASKAYAAPASKTVAYNYFFSSNTVYGICQDQTSTNTPCSSENIGGPNSTAAVYANVSNNTFQLFDLGSAGNYAFINIGSSCSQGVYKLEDAGTGKTLSTANITIGNSVILSSHHQFNVSCDNSNPSQPTTQGQSVQQVTDQTFSATGSGTSSVTSCESSGGPFSWFICASLHTLGAAEDFIINDIIQPLLKTNPVAFNAPQYCSNSNDPKYQSCSQNDRISATVYNVWSNFRVYGDILLVIALLAAIIVEAAGSGSIAEAYTIKRMLPRILAAAILINLSIYIVAAAEDIVNVLGSGIQSLMLTPFSGINGASSGTGASIHVSGTTGVLSTLGIGGLALAAGFTEGIAGIALFIIGGFLIAAIGVLITLLIRQGLLVILLLTSPIAFALYCLPNTEQYFRKWWGLLMKTLLVYPIVMIIITGASIAALIVSNFSFGVPVIGQLMGILAAAAPLFLVPFAFRLSGGVIGQAANQINNVAGRVREPIRNLRQQNRRTRLDRAREGNLFRGEGALARRSSTLAQGVMLAPTAGLNPRRMRSRFAAAKSAHTSASAAKAGENEFVAAVISNDDLLNASLSGNGTEADARAYLYQLGQRGRELEQNVASINQAKRAVGREAFMDAAVTALPGTGTGFASGPAEMLEAINRVAGNDRARAARLLAGARSQAERARRVDLYGAGFATSADQMAQLHNNQTNAQAVNEVMTDEALLTKSAGEIGSARNNALTNMSAAMVRRLAGADLAVTTAQNALTTATAGGNPVAISYAQQNLNNAIHERKRILAATASYQDVASQVATENSQVIGAVLGQRNGQPLTLPNGTTRPMTYLDQIEIMRPDEEFQQYRREYGTATAAAGVAGAAVPPAGGVPGAPPVVGPPAPPGGPPSDRRLKTNIKYISTLNNGINLYSFRYVWGGPYYVGVMAQEIIAIYPKAVGIDNQGYYWVDYRYLGLELKTLKEWEKGRPGHLLT